ncbi:hypothetical protein DL96DRAFT_1685169 [Flagelloscypha sp. PMI_526]|nr:hypothetical protein DL96DRAFT_1685169 [Flagelloscypha sp. PMI_526]
MSIAFKDFALEIHSLILREILLFDDGSIVRSIGCTSKYFRTLTLPYQFYTPRLLWFFRSLLDAHDTFNPTKHLFLRLDDLEPESTTYRRTLMLMTMTIEWVASSLVTLYVYLPSRKDSETTTINRLPTFQSRFPHLQHYFVKGEHIFLSKDTIFPETPLYPSLTHLTLGNLGDSKEIDSWFTGFQPLSKDCPRLTNMALTDLTDWSSAIPLYAVHWRLVQLGGQPLFPTGPHVPDPSFSLLPSLQSLRVTVAPNPYWDKKWDLARNGHGKTPEIGLDLNIEVGPKVLAPEGMEEDWMLRVREIEQDRNMCKLYELLNKC